MTRDTDAILDRRRLRRQVTLWRVVAALVAIVAIAAVGARFSGKFSPGGEEHIARLRISGFIGDSATRRQAIEAIAKSNAKAVILHVDSPGGGAAAAEGLFHDLRRLNEKKPVVAVVDTLAASGGYIAAISADHIVARRASFVGSIGVLIQYPNVSKLLANLGVDVESVKSSPLKAEPSGFSPTPPEAREALRALVLDTYDWFRGLVKERRKLDEATLARVADGRVFTGTQAISLRLVDAIGGEPEALDWLKREKGVNTALPVRDWPRRSPFDLASAPQRIAATVLGAFGLEGAARLADRVSAKVEAGTVDGLLLIWQPPTD